MLGTKLKRLTALLLCVSMLLGYGTVIAFAAGPVSASSSGSSSTGQTLADIKELLNAISYDEYQAKNQEVPRATNVVEVPIFDFIIEHEKKMTITKVDDNGKPITVNGEVQTVELGFEKVERDGKEALFTPQDGAVSWNVDIPETGKYAIKIEYYADKNRSTSIERILKINNKVPFAEARFLTLPKNWINDYAAVVYEPQDGETVAGIIDEAVRLGFKDVAEVEGGKVTLAFAGTMTAAMREFCDDRDIRFFVNDIKGNELRPTATDSPEWMTYYLRDSSGYYTNNFEFVFEKGVNTITLESQNEPMSIKSITLYPYEDVMGYDAYIEYLKQKGVDVDKAGVDIIKIEAEEPTAMSNKTIYPAEDRSCAINSPSDVTRSVLNTLGGEKWATAGQWVEYKFKVENSGMYDIVSRFRQNVLDGMYTCRTLYMYSDAKADSAGYYNGVPFAEAMKLSYDYSDEWQVSALADGAKTDTNGDGEITSKDKDRTYPVYLEAGVEYTIRMEVTLGKMGDVVRRVQETLTAVNNCYLNIIKLTGMSPDPYRDYGFMQVMPDTMIEMVIQSGNLYDLADELTELAGGESSNVATLKKVARLLEEMGTDDDDVAKNLSNLKTYIGTLGTFLSDAQTQPLQLDYILIQPMGEDLPKATPNFFETFAHEMGGFFQSFFRDYNSMGSLEETGDASVEVWMESARDQSQVLRNLINNDFTPNTGIAVDLKLVAAGTLLPSILAGSGPDVSLGRAQGDVINYAIRSALLNIDQFEDFEGKVIEEYEDENGDIVQIKDGVRYNFNEAAMLVLGIKDADEKQHYYGLPETQSFPMMFVRTDVLADLDIEIPKTWDDVMAAIPTLQANNMQIGLTTDYKIFLYQQNGDLFADEGMRINLDSQLALASFDKMCNLFTMYSFPYVYNAANRFRTGEMPLIIGDYVGTYNQLKIFATEIQGKWEFLPLPGEIQADGSVNNVSISGIVACVLVSGCEEETLDDAWAFMKWYTGKECQKEYANEMVAILGPSGKQATANEEALAELPWTTAELEQVQAQFQNLASVPNYPGAYIIDRYTNFAFLSAYNDKADPADALLQYINTINKEIARKRAEFGLETLTDSAGNEYKNLLTKRLAQIAELIESIDNADYADLMNQVAKAIKSDDKAAINDAAEAVRKAYEALDPDGSIYKADRIAVMGYDMEDTELTKDQKRRARKCYSYEIYENTSKLETKLRCMADFLDVAAEYTPD